MTFDQSIKTASGMVADGDYLRAVRFLRSLGMMFPTARKYVDEIRDGKPWMKRAAKRAEPLRIRRK